MVNEQYIAFAEKLIELSKQKKLRWKYLDSEPTLCKGMGWIEEKKDMFSFMNETYTINNFDSEDSFVCSKDGTYVVIFVSHRSALPKLYVIPNTYKNVVILSPDDYGEYITRLHNLVKSSFPHADKFISAFLNDKE